MLCSEIMSRHMSVIAPDTSCRQILDLLARDPDKPLIVANEAGFLLGVVTAKDFLRIHLDRTKGNPLDPSSPAQDDQALRSTMQKLSEFVAKDLMIDAPIVAQVDTAVTSVIVPMVQQSLTFVPVVREGKIEGIIGRGEIIKHMMAMLPAD